MYYIFFVGKKNFAFKRFAIFNLMERKTTILFKMRTLFCNLESNV